MRNRLIAGLVLSVPLFLASCSGAMTKSDTPFSEVPLPDDDTVLIYVYRMESMVGSAVLWPVKLDGEVVANISQNAYIVIETTPGEHVVTIGEASSGPFGGVVGYFVGEAMRDAEESFAEKEGALPEQQQRVYWFRSKGFGVDFVTREEALPEISRMMYEPLLSEG